MWIFGSSGAFVFTFTFLVLCSFSVDTHAAKAHRKATGRFRRYAPSHNLRTKRSLVELNDMVEAVTHRKGTDFVGYGNWCGPGGGGPPLDHIDRCCRYHDLCYDRVSAHNLCEGDSTTVYRTNYEWKLDKKRKENPAVICDSNQKVCEESVCRCDSYLANCLARNIDTFNEKYRHPMDLEKLLEATV